MELKPRPGPEQPKPVTKNITKRKLFTRQNVLAVLGWLFAVLVSIGALTVTPVLIYDIQKNQVLQVEAIRQQLIEGQHSLYKVVDNYSPPRTVRMQDFSLKAKGVVLKMRPNAGKVPAAQGEMSQDELDKFVVRVFEEADARRISPWIPMAFAMKESQFYKNAKSTETPHGRAKGLFQVLDPTARLLLGKDYYFDCQFDVQVAITLWFRYWDVLSTACQELEVEELDDKIKWVAVGYLCGENVLARQYGKWDDPNVFLTEYSKIARDCPPDYAQSVLNNFHEMWALDMKK